ncbi:hypothetical protein [Algoriphagus sp.]|uniref:hypothetical protein n=1 Tax=Algoriphagus sp. TaxID=1872435 RepID=UPI0026324446|nr:hypothetical protein [Algoriphagus sp.]
MKNLLTSLSLYLLVLTLAYAQPNAYQEAMKSQLAAMQQIDSPEKGATVKNAFLRISEMNSTEWLPLYYAALVEIETAFRFDGNKDAAFDQAIATIKRAEKLSPSNSELTALHGYALMGKLSLDPASRGQELSPQVMQLFGKAIDQDRENPRAVILMAQMEQGMAQFFGNGPEKACGMARLSQELFDKEKEKIDEHYILPTWGEAAAKELYSTCN